MKKKIKWIVWEYQENYSLLGKEGEVTFLLWKEGFMGIVGPALKTRLPLTVVLCTARDFREK